MKKKRFSVEQIVAILKQAELGIPVAKLIRQLGVSEQTFYLWKKKYTGVEIGQVRQLKQRPGRRYQGTASGPERWYIPGQENQTTQRPYLAAGR